ncbi:MAG TPA: histidine phosphatase family protein [Gammaproteobacteria bacterium]|nr:histidine phosphatase family protein [Gammaproteobacteria bacterium]
MTRTLLLLRHAQAGRSHARVRDDFDRILTADGQAQARAIGARLREAGLVPDAIVSSPAERARETATLACHELDLPRTRIEYDKRLYEDNSVDVMPVVEECPEQAETVLVVGHNPGLERLVHGLARDSANVSLGTASVARLRFEGGWTDLRPGGATLVEVIRAEG